MSRRIEWIDPVKAVSVLLVVFMHATNMVIDLGGPTWITALLHDVNTLLEPLRMPVFFLVSGMLAASAVHRPWRDTTNRTTGMIYLYVVWMGLFMGLQALLGVSLGQPILAVLFGKSGYWYLYATALFFVIARLMRNQPAWLVVAVAVVPNLLRPATATFFEGVVPGSLYTSLAMNLCFFLAGAYFKQIVAGLAEKAQWSHTAALGMVSLGAGMVWLNSPSAVGQSYFPLSVVWIAFGISVAVQVTRNGAPPWASYLGARTLPIYVWQWPVLFVLGLVIPGAAMAHPIGQVFFPLAITAAIGATAVWLHAKPAFRHVFTSPAWVTRPPSVRVSRPAVATAAQ